MDFYKRYNELRQKHTVLEAAEEALQEFAHDDFATIRQVKGKKGIYEASSVGTKAEGDSAPQAAIALLSALRTVNKEYEEDSWEPWNEDPWMDDEYDRDECAPDELDYLLV